MSRIESLMSAWEPVADELMRLTIGNRLRVLVPSTHRSSERQAVRNLTQFADVSRKVRRNVRAIPLDGGEAAGEPVSHTTRGFRLEPSEEPAGQRGAEIVFALRGTEMGRLVFNAVQVDYHVGDTAHRVILDSGLAVCIHPRGRPPRRCAAPTDLG